jgi:tRNA dimethylallyltransferase
LERRAAQHGPERLHRVLCRVDPESGSRVLLRDTRRIVRALEVYFSTGMPMTAHFAHTRSLIADCDVVTVALHLSTGALVDRVSRRVDAQFERGIVGEVQALLTRVPADARPFGGLVYRQVVEMLRGDRDETATRALIVVENRRYARRQLIWFRKEPNLMWFDGPGERLETWHRVRDALTERGLQQRGDGT